MSRSRKKCPCSYIVAWQGSNKFDKQHHNKILRNIGKENIIAIKENIENADNISCKYKKTEGLNIYCFRNDGGNIWWLESELEPEDYRKLFRK